MLQITSAMMLVASLAEGKNADLITVEPKSLAFEAHLTLEEIAQIQSLGPTQYTEYFEMMLDARWRDLSAEEAAFVWGRLHCVREANCPLEEDRRAGIMPDTANVFFDNLKSHQGTFYYYFILFHEAEHVLQVFKSAKKLGIDLNSFWRVGTARLTELSQDENYRNLMEEYAKSAEWFFAHHAPRTMTEAALKQLEVLAAQDSYFSNVAYRLKNSNLSLSEYLDKNKLTYGQKSSDQANESFEQQAKKQDSGIVQACLQMMRRALSVNN